MSARDLGRIAIAATCVALGLPPDTLGLAAVLSQARAWTAPGAAWRRDRLLWPSRRPGQTRPTGEKP
jgi:hypothetical protein